MNGSTKPTLTRVLELAMRGALDGVRVALPGKIVTYDKLKQRADVQPFIDDGHEAEGGLRVAEHLPIVTDVPVAFQGAGGYSETFPIHKGDTVLLVFCSSSIARWKISGQVGDPSDDRHHALPDAIAYPGVRDFAHALTGVPEDAWVITTPTGKQIRLGSASSAQSALRGEAFLSALDTLLVAIKAGLLAAGNTTVGGTAIAATFQTAVNTFDAAASTYKSAKVKVD